MARKTEEKPSVFELSSPFRDPFRHRLFGMMRGSIERVFLLEQLNRIYREVSERPAEQGDFLERTMQVLDVEYEVTPEDTARIPKTGPVVVVANHPFGGVEGVVLCSLLRRVRPDVRIMANFLLARMPEMHEYAFFVDPFGSAQSPRANLGPLKECIRWMTDGHMLAVFPSGEVSHLDLQQRQVVDPKWSETIARIIRRSGAAALPVFIEGRNSALFHMMGLVHPRLRTAMLPRELVRKQGSHLRFRIGAAVPFARLSAMERDEEMMDYLRLRTYVLRSRGETDRTPRQRRMRRRARETEMLPIADPLYPEVIAQDVSLLPPEATLLETDDFAVLAVTADQIPNMIHEIGRLREITFREEGEGTGKPLDLDRFDSYYTHLVLWSRKAQEVAGAYRIGKADEVLRRFGKKGLYSSTLFRYRRKLLDAMGPALELGRSFIRREYQKQYASLLLLWKGIGRMIVREPKYRNLFGPVSINNEYNTSSRQMLEAFLRANNFDTAWARYVKPRHRPKRGKTTWDPKVFNRMINSPEEVSNLIAEIERDRKGVPILLKQYLKLGGKLLSFNVDPDFSDVLDGLIWVDLLGIDQRIVLRFLGRRDAQAFLAHHGVDLKE